MSGFKVGLADAMAQLVRSAGEDCKEVIDWDDRTVYGGYCSTCAYEYAVVDITYKDSEGFTSVYTYSDDFGSLIRRLAGE